MNAAVLQPCHPNADPAPAGWSARLQLQFALRAGRTVAVRRRHQGPLRVQRAFHPEGPVCHLYLLHPPGGLVGGDRLEVEAGVAGGGHALVTTPAAQKVYRAAGTLQAVQHQHLSVAPGACLEWLPQEQILFQGARLASRTRVQLAAGSRFIGWEVTGLGRPAAGEGFRHGGLDNRLELWREHRPLLLERQRLSAGDGFMTAPWGLGGRAAWGTLVATPADGAGLDRARAALAGAPGEAGATQLEDLLVVRWRGDQPARGRALFEHLWAELRPGLLGRPACSPRIWRT